MTVAVAQRGRSVLVRLDGDGAGNAVVVSPDGEYGPTMFEPSIVAWGYWNEDVDPELGARAEELCRTLTAAAAWREEDHPRDPGGEDGGQFVEKTMMFRDLPLDERKAFQERIKRAQTFADEWLDTKIADRTQAELDELAEEIEQYREDDPEDLDGMIEMTTEELARAAAARDELQTAMRRLEDFHALPADADEIVVEFAPLGDNTWGQHYAETHIPGSVSDPITTHSRWIRVNPEKPIRDMQGTMTHEFGHYLDIQLGGHREPHREGVITGSWFSKSEEAAGWRAAVRDTEAVKALERIPDSERVYREYLLTNEELWARSYAQWVALRTGSDELMKSVHAPGDRDGLPERQWSSADFGPVATEFDKLMERYLDG